MDNLAIDYIDKRNAMIEAVSAADIKRTAGRFLSNMQLLVMMVGEPASPTDNKTVQ
jgi:zinc protease